MEDFSFSISPPPSSESPRASLLGTTSLFLQRLQIYPIYKVKAGGRADILPYLRWQIIKSIDFSVTDIICNSQFQYMHFSEPLD